MIQLAGALAGGVLGLIGQNRAARSADKAAERTAKQSQRARDEAKKADRQTRQRVQKAVEDENKAVRADLGVARQEERKAYQEAAEWQTTQTAALQATAAQERQVAIDDEAQRFVRLRQAAEAGGFNPLTVLAAGYTGASMPTGFLSSSDALSVADLALNRAINRSSTAVGIRTAISQTRGKGVQEGVAAGQQAYASTYNATMGGVEASNAARSSAYNDTLSGWSQLSSMVQAGAGIGSDLARYRLDSDALALDRERLAVDKVSIDTDRQRSQAEIAYNSWLMSRPATGATSAGGVSGGALSGGVDRYGRPIDASGNLLSRDIMLPNGQVLNVDETATPQNVIEDEFGESAETVGMWHAATSADAAAWDYLKQDWNDFTTRLSNLPSQAFNRVASVLSSPWIPGYSSPVKHQPLRLTIDGTER